MISPNQLQEVLDKSCSDKFSPIDECDLSILEQTKSTILSIDGLKCINLDQGRLRLAGLVIYQLSSNDAIDI